jgi:hypothetical protein
MNRTSLISGIMQALSPQQLHFILPNTSLNEGTGADIVTIT